MVRLVSLMHSSRAEIVAFPLLPTRNWDSDINPILRNLDRHAADRPQLRTCSASTDR